MLSAKIRTKWIIGRTKWILEYFPYFALVEYRTMWIRIKWGPSVYSNKNELSKIILSLHEKDFLSVRDHSSITSSWFWPFLTHPPYHQTRGISILGEVRNVEISRVTQQLLCSKSHDFLAIFDLTHSKINQIA